jgi:transcriptional regulator with XRE-family HTH domain
MNDTLKTPLAPNDAVADNLRMRRAWLRLSQRDVAERMQAAGHKWHQQTVAHSEAGRRRFRVDEVAALAEVLETDFDWMFMKPLPGNSALNREMMRDAHYVMPVGADGVDFRALFDPSKWSRVDEGPNDGP